MDSAESQRYMEKGKRLTSEGKFDSAEKQFLKAMDEPDIQVFFELGKLYYITEKYKKAIKFRSPSLKFTAMLPSGRTTSYTLGVSVFSLKLNP